MAKRQKRIHDLEKLSDKNSLLGEKASFCMNDNRVIFGTIIGFQDNKFILRDQLLKNNILSVLEIAEVVIEKADSL